MYRAGGRCASIPVTTERRFPNQHLMTVCDSGRKIARTLDGLGHDVARAPWSGRDERAI